MKKPILIIYTGGTIGMEKCADGIYHPTSGFQGLAEKTIAPAIWQQMPPHEYLEITPAIDSSDMTSEHWQLIARKIIENYDSYSGFIVLHGTDTMAYTAAMLSFLLGELDKTVILTGSQITLAEPCSDGANNLLVSLQLIEQCVPEVCIYFANQLFRGNRASKISTSAMIAFESANYPVLAKFENRLKLFKESWLPAAKPTFELPSLGNINVPVIYLTPVGMVTSVIDSAVACGAKGLVLVSYGSGNVPVNNPDFMHSLTKANENGVVIVNVSQCVGGHVNNSYAASKPLTAAGVVSGEDMTIEAAVVKIYYLLAKYQDDLAKVKSLINQPLRGELSRLS